MDATLEVLEGEYLLAFRVHTLQQLRNDQLLVEPALVRDLLRERSRFLFERRMEDRRLPSNDALDLVGGDLQFVGEVLAPLVVLDAVRRCLLLVALPYDRWKT